MAKNRHVQHLRSSVEGKIPNSEDLNYGEIAINFHKNGETLFLKNSDNKIESFKYTESLRETQESIIAEALAKLEATKAHNDSVRSVRDSVRSVRDSVSLQMETISETFVQMNKRIIDLEKQVNALAQQ